MVYVSKAHNYFDFWKIIIRPITNEIVFIFNVNIFKTEWKCFLVVLNKKNPFGFD